MDPWIHGSAAGAAARPAAGAAAGGAAAASAAVCIYYVNIEGVLRAPLYVHDKKHTATAEAAAPPVAAPAAGLAAAPAADPCIHGSLDPYCFIMNHIFYFEMKNTNLYAAKI